MIKWESICDLEMGVHSIIVVFITDNDLVTNISKELSLLIRQWALIELTRKDVDEYETKLKELENAISKCEKEEEEFKNRTCKFRSPKNCDFCSFHSDCDEHWKEGDAK